MSWQMQTNGSVSPRMPDELWFWVIEAMINGLSSFLSDAKYKATPKNDGKWRIKVKHYEWGDKSVDLYRR